MNELRPDTLELLARARSGGTMPARDRARLKGALFAKLAVASAATTATAAAAAGTAKTTAATTAGAAAGTVKLLVVGAMAGAVAGAFGTGVAALSFHDRIDEAMHRPLAHAYTAGASSAPRATSSPPPPSTLSVDPPRSAVAPAPMPTAPETSAAPVTRPPPRVTRRSVEPADAPIALPAPEVRAAGSLAEEARLLREADRALEVGDTDGALAALATHAARFPGSVLEPERSAERIFALCRAGRVAEARAEADAFLLTHPASPLAARVDASCKRAP